MAKSKSRGSRYFKESETKRTQIGEDIDNLLLIAFAGFIVYYLVTNQGTMQTVQSTPFYPAY
jgi:hypothetical protein